MPMAIQCGQKMIQQFRPACHAPQPFAQHARRIKPIADLAQVPRASAPGNHTSKRAGNIRQLAQGCTDGFARKRRIVKPLHQR